MRELEGGRKGRRKTGKERERGTEGAHWQGREEGEREKGSEERDFTNRMEGEGGKVVHNEQV